MFYKRIEIIITILTQTFRFNFSKVKMKYKG